MKDIPTRILLALSGLALVAGAVTGLAGVPARASTMAAKAALVQTASGRLLVDASGRTLYVFAKDKKNKSTCYATCAKYWPPLLVGKGAHPAAHVSGISGAFGVTSRKGGTRQLTFDGAPLYLFAGDHSAGDMNGQGAYLNGGFWWAVATGMSSSSTSSKTTTDKLTISITDTGGTVWGKVALHYASSSATCSQATCTYQIPSGTKVQLAETPSSSSTWPFSKWTVMSPQGTTTKKGTSLQVTMQGNLTVTAVYVLGSGYSG